MVRENPHGHRGEPRHWAFWNPVLTPGTDGAQPCLLHDILRQVTVAIAPARDDPIEVVECLAVNASNLFFGGGPRHRSPVVGSGRRHMWVWKPTFPSAERA